MKTAAHRLFKDRLYEQFARIGKALASPHRLEFLELLAQSERTVESLANEVGVSLANASQHLLALRQAGLVKSRKQGLFVHYRLAGESVFELTRAMRIVAELQLADLERLVQEHFDGRADAEAVGMDELLKKAGSGEMVILDTRPVNEYEAGHIAGAVSVPVDTLQQRLRRLPRSKEYIAYCRGPYCVYADQAVELLRSSGRKAKRLGDGFPEWKAAGFPISIGAEEGV
ncbi:MAG: ArsR/SmtB family transcription factor [Devosia sp.]